MPFSEKNELAMKTFRELVMKKYIELVDNKLKMRLVLF